MKIGTMKINPHGTRLGERFIKVAFNKALEYNLDEIYVTVFEHHEALVSLFIEIRICQDWRKRDLEWLRISIIKRFYI